MTADARFWNRIARRYARTPIADPASYEHKLDLTRRYLDESMDVLEVGCGTGGTARLHAPFVRSFRAIDVSERMIEIARERAVAEGVPEVNFEIGSVADIQARDEYDAVLAMSVLHLVDDLDAALATLVRALKPGGVLVSSTACLAEHHGFLRYVAPAGRALGVFPRFAIFSVDALRERIAAAGLHEEVFWMPDRRRAHVAFIVARRSP
jgi:2-polyprenyl-3-methyl-5-hydroxy-6-metoxy-1,4-benzoquinol methylase